MDANARVQLHSGRSHPVLGLGTWQLTEDTAGTVAEAIRLGYRLIDTSGDYGTQPGVGEGIRKSGIDREEIYLVTKVEEDEDAYDAARRNLEELELDFADLMLIHRPPPGGVGGDLWRGLVRARDEGFTRDIGVSNYSVEELKILIEGTGVKPVVNQVEWSPFGWSRQMLDYCRSQGILVQAWSPLTRSERLDQRLVVQIAKDCGKTPAQVVLRWHLQIGTVPLPKANSPQHLAENLDVFDFELSDEQMEELSSVNQEWSALGESLQYL